MIGIISQSSMLYGVQQCPRFGLFDPVYKTTDGRLVFAKGRNGSVTGFAQIKPAAVRRGLVPFAAGAPGPRLDDPVRVAVIHEQRDGSTVGICGPWDEVASFACGEAFPELCSQMRRHHLEGFNLARFLTTDVERYAQHAVGGGGFDFEANATKLRVFALIRDELRAANPGWGDIEPRPAQPTRHSIDPMLN